MKDFREGGFKGKGLAVLVCRFALVLGLGHSSNRKEQRVVYLENVLVLLFPVQLS